MKRIILGMIVTTIAFTSIAQKTQKIHTDKENVEAKDKSEDKRFELLNLTSEQKEKMKAINADFKKNMEALKNSTTISDNDKKVKRREILNDRKSQIKSILTPEQQVKAKEYRNEKMDGKRNHDRKDDLKDNRKDRKDDMKEDKEDGKDDMKEDKEDGKDDMKEDKEDGKDEMKEERKEKIENLSKELNLTQDQSTKIAAINATLKKNIASVKNNTLLSEEQKREQIKSLMKGHKADIQSILTNEQKEQLKKLKEGRPHKKKE